MSEQDLQTAESNHAEEVLCVVLPANYKPTEMMDPGEKPFYSPTPAVAASSVISAEQAVLPAWVRARAAS
jgi:hypothetical protein